MVLVFIILLVFGVGIPCILQLQRLSKGFGISSLLLGTVSGTMTAGILSYFVRPALAYPGVLLLFCVSVTGSATLITIIGVDSRNYSYSSTEDTKPVALLLYGSLWCLWLLFIIISSWDLFRATDYASLIGEVNVHTAEEAQIENVIDFSHPRIVTQGQAKAKAKAKSAELGPERSLIDLTTVVPNQGDQWVIPPEPKSGDFFGWRQVKQRHGLHGWLEVNADNPQSQATLRSIPMSTQGILYTPNSFFGYNTYRRIYSQFPSEIPIEYTFHISDRDQHPQNVVTLGKPTIGLGMYKISRVVVEDALTGEITPYTLKDLPEEYNLIHPEEMAISRIDSWGTYRFGWRKHAFGRLNLEQIASDGLEKEVWLVKGTDGRLKYYAAVRWKSSSDTIDGFALYDTRDGSVDLYESPSADPAKVRASLKNIVPATSGSPWEVTEPKQFRTKDGLLVWLATYEADSRFREVGATDSLAIIAAHARSQDAAISELRKRMFEVPEIRKQLAETKEADFVITGFYTLNEQDQTIFVFSIQGDPNKVIRVSSTNMDPQIPLRENVKTHARYVYLPEVDEFTLEADSLSVLNK